jgi:hypothetical protein
VLPAAATHAMIATSPALGIAYSVSPASDPGTRRPV